jgi:hypothetical protein
MVASRHHMQTEKPWYNLHLRYFQLVEYTLSNLPWLDKISVVEKNATIDRRIDLTGACTIKNYGFIIYGKWRYFVVS